MVEYTGPRIDKEEGDLRYADKPITYLFGIGDGTQVIDGHGIAMFLNHSCAANCETEEIDGRVWIMALRDIAPGEELCYDYCLYDGEEEEAPCNCGATTCRGTMFSPEELKRRKRMERKAGSRSNPKKSEKKQVASGGKRDGKRKQGTPRKPTEAKNKTAKKQPDTRKKTTDKRKKEAASNTGPNKRASGGKKRAGKERDHKSR